MTDGSLALSEEPEGPTIATTSEELMDTGGGTFDATCVNWCFDPIRIAAFTGSRSSATRSARA